MDLRHINSIPLAQLKELAKEYQTRADEAQRVTAELQRTAQRLRKAVQRKKREEKSS